MSYFINDEQLALEIQEEFNCTGITENAVFPKEKQNGYRPRTLIDQTLEYIDPTPNIYTLFVQFNEKFFWNKLLPVQVKWSPRMTSCAGICSFQPRSRECVISLSTPLLKLRPRKDLVETLLHEMIHAYLFLTNNNTDRDGHGPVFQSHMHRINKIAGTKITIYHSFHDEVRLYQQHWWRCNGPCVTQPPFFGMVKRAMNRAPGPNDFWWKDHKARCNGEFIKIKEPEKPVKEKKNGKANGKSDKPANNKSIADWLNNSKDKSNIENRASSITQPPKTKSIRGSSSSKPNKNLGNDHLKKLGNTTNNVHGWGTGGPGGSSSSNNKFGSTSQNNKIPSSTPKKATPKFSGSGTLGGNPTGRSKLLDLYANSGTSGGNATGRSKLLDLYPSSQVTSSVPKGNNLMSKGNTKIEGKPIGRSNSNLFSNSTLPSTSKNSASPSKSPGNTSRQNTLDDFMNSSKRQVPELLKVPCPKCNKFVSSKEVNDHLDLCLLQEDFVIELEETSNSSLLQENSIIDLVEPNTSKKRKSDSDLDTTKTKLFKNDNNSSNTMSCPLCEKVLNVNDFNNHLDICVNERTGGIFDKYSVNKSGNDIPEDNDVLVSETSFNSFQNSKCSPQICLICEKPITAGYSLPEHLEECIGEVFNDSEEQNDYGVKEVSSIKEVKDKNIGNHADAIDSEEMSKYPCPICMELIKEQLMNDHIDTCLNGSIHKE